MPPEKVLGPELQYNALSGYLPGSSTEDLTNNRTTETSGQCTDVVLSPLSMYCRISSESCGRVRFSISFVEPRSGDTGASSSSTEAESSFARVLICGYTHLILSKLCLIRPFRSSSTSFSPSPSVADACSAWMSSKMDSNSERHSAAER